MDHKLIEELRNRKQARQKKKKRLMIAAGLLIFAGLMLITGFLFWRRHGPLQDDPNASTQKPLTKVEQQAALQKAADESRFRFKMNTAPTVTWSGDLEDEQEADWYIINSMENPWDMEVVITSAQDGSELYRSAPVKTGRAGTERAVGNYTGTGKLHSRGHSHRNRPGKRRNGRNRIRRPDPDGRGKAAKLELSAKAQGSNTIRILQVNQKSFADHQKTC